jgi:hypothetical protein
MTDKTSWTKPPSLHRYGDSRPAGCGAEGVSGSPPPPPPEGGDEPRRPTGAQRSGAEASGRGPPGAEQKGSAGSWSGIGRPGARRRRRDHDVSTTGTPRVGGDVGARISVTCSRPGQSIARRTRAALIVPFDERLPSTTRAGRNWSETLEGVRDRRWRS